MSQFMHLRESCAGCREAVGEALTAARVGRALSIVNLVRSAETVLLVEGNTDCTATGEGQAGSAVSKTSRHARTSSIGTSYVKENGAPWKGAVFQRVRSPPGNCRSSR